MSSRRRLAVALVGALVLGGSLIAASRLGAEEAAAPKAEPLPSLLDGIPQSGTALGSPKAPVTLVEYADLQCPYCAEWTHRAFPTLVDRYVRQGEVRIVFRGLAFLGPDSDRALRTAVAAGRENRLWHVVEGLYHRQGHENSGWVTEPLLDEIAGPRALEASRMHRGSSPSWPTRAARPGRRGSPARRPFRSGRPAGRCRRCR